MRAVKEAYRRASEDWQVNSPSGILVFCSVSRLLARFSSCRNSSSQNAFSAKLVIPLAFRCLKTAQYDLYSGDAS